MKRYLLLIFFITRIAFGSDLKWSLDTGQIIGIEYNESGSLWLIDTNQAIKLKRQTAAYHGALAAGDFNIASNKDARIKYKLDAYDKGKITIKDLNEKGGNEGNRELIGYYLIHSNNISAMAKLPISLSYAGFGAYVEASEMAKEYSNVYSNDWRGWRTLGNTYLTMDILQNDRTNFLDDAIVAYSNAVKLGDKDSILMLAICAEMHERLDIVENLVPQLMDLKNARNTPKTQKLNLLSVL